MKLNEREGRTIRIAAIVLVAYLTLFYGMRGYRTLEQKRTEYHQLIAEAEDIKRELLPYENRILLLEKLREKAGVDVSKLSTGSMVADAGAAIQDAAKQAGVKLGSVRESRGRASAKELATIQLEAEGPVDKVLALLDELKVLGFPLIIDSVQLNMEKPGTLKASINVSILDYDQWKQEEENV